LLRTARQWSKGERRRKRVGSTERVALRKTWPGKGRKGMPGATTKPPASLAHHGSPRSGGHYVCVLLRPLTMASLPGASREQVPGGEEEEEPEPEPEVCNPLSTHRVVYCRDRMQP